MNQITTNRGVAAQLARAGVIPPRPGAPLTSRTLATPAERASKKDDSKKGDKKKSDAKEDDREKETDQAEDDSLKTKEGIAGWLGDIFGDQQGQ